MNDLKKNFIDFALDEQILKFGAFTLKSGRVSPYYFNTGVCNTGDKLKKLADQYANYIKNSNLEFDVIFGPAYKGITLSSSISLSLFNNYSINKPFSSNRKERKNHGDAGNLLGCELKGSVMVVDDVISSGSSIIESIKIIKNESAETNSVLVALDRMEVGNKERASYEIAKDYNIAVHSIITLDDIIDYLIIKKHNNNLAKMKEYIDQYKR